MRQSFVLSWSDLSREKCFSKSLLYTKVSVTLTDDWDDLDWDSITISDDILLPRYCTIPKKELPRPDVIDAIN